MIKYLLPSFLAFLLLLPIITLARSGSLSGRVIDASGKPLVFANILLLQSGDSALAKTDLTDEKGEFQLTPVANGNYMLKIFLIGYDNYSATGITIHDNTIQLPEIKLGQGATSLKEVTVNAQKPFLEVKADKLVVNVANSITSAGTSVMEVLSRSPGVTVDQNDNISLKGKLGVNVVIDGRNIPVSQSELANMLKSMPSNTVDKIEIIANPSAKYDAAGTAGIINIKTKKDKKMGANGTVTAGYGQGVYDKENLGFNLNYRNKKFNIYANYNSSFRTGLNKVDWNREFYTNDVFSSAFVQHNYTVMHFQNQGAAIGADYNLSSKTTIGASLNGDNFYLGAKGYYFANVLGADRMPAYYFATNNRSSGNWNNFAPNVHLQHTIDSTGKKLSVDADYAHYWNKNSQDFTTNYYKLNGTELQPDFILRGKIAGATDIKSIKADYLQPLENGVRLEAGLKTSLVHADNEPKFYNRSTGTEVYDSGKSDHFIYNENINAAYVNVSEDGKKWSTQLGLRAENTSIDGLEKVTGQTFSNSYLRLFPSLAAQRHINAENDLGITLSRRIERPEYNDLNPYKFFVDPSTFKEGNPRLNPAPTYAAELSHVFKQRLVTTLSYSITSDVITEVIMPSTTLDRVTIQTKVNLATMNYYGLSGAYTLPIKKWWTNVTNFDAYYSVYSGNLANTNLRAGKPTFDINTSNKFTFTHDWSAELSFFYQSRQVYGFLNLTQISMLNAGVQKNFPKQHITMRLSANDIFWHGNENGSSFFINYSEYFNTKHDTRQANISISYRFGNKAVNPVRKHGGGAEDEKKRVGGAG